MLLCVTKYACVIQMAHAKYDFTQPANEDTLQRILSYVKDWTWKVPAQWMAGMTPMVAISMYDHHSWYNCGYFSVNKLLRQQGKLVKQR